MKKRRRAINFDLDTHALQMYYPNQDYHQAYYDVRKFFENNGFDHRQGSGYVSDKPLYFSDVVTLCGRLNARFPWLGSCVSVFDVTIVTGRHSLKKYLNAAPKTGLNVPVFENKPDNVKEQETDKPKINSAQTNSANTQAPQDYDNAAPFPDTKKFKALSNYRCMNEFNGAVLAIRQEVDTSNQVTGYSYVTWLGDTTSGLTDGHYDLSREAAMQDFAVRANLIPKDRVLTEEEYQAKKHINEIESILEVGNNKMLSFYVTEIYDEESAKKLGSVVFDFFTEDYVYNNKDIESVLANLDYNDGKDVTAFSQLYTIGLGSNKDFSILTEEKKAYISENLNDVLKYAKQVGTDREYDIDMDIISGRQQSSGRH